MRPRLLIFDFDGTLGDTRQNIIFTFRATMERLGLEMRSEEVCASTIGLTLLDGFKAMYADMDDAMAQRAVDTYREIFEENYYSLIPPLFPNVATTLERLHNAGYRMSIASSRATQSLNIFLREMGIAHYFEYVVGSDSVTCHKPQPEPVNITLDALDVLYTDALVIGDMPVDVLMAHNAVVKVCAVTYGNATREELERIYPTYIIDDFAELLNILEV